MTDTQTIRSPAAIERARRIGKLDDIWVLWSEGMLQPWQQELLQDNLEARSPMTPEDLLDAIDWRGISVSDFVPFTNERVAAHYGTCSIQHHHLQILQRYRLSSGQGAIGPLNNAIGCRFSSNRARYPRSKNLHAHCRTCNTTIKWNIASSRLIATLKLPTSDLWKGVVTRKSYPSK